MRAVRVKRVVRVMRIVRDIMVMNVIRIIRVIRTIRVIRSIRVIRVTTSVTRSDTEKVFSRLLKSVAPPLQTHTHTPPEQHETSKTRQCESVVRQTDRERERERERERPHW